MKSPTSAPAPAVAVASDPVKAVSRGGAASDMARSLIRRCRPLLFALSCLAIWEVVSLANTQAIPRATVPAPTDIVSALAGLIKTSLFWTSIRETVQGWAAGLGLAAVAAVPIGLILGSVGIFYTLTRAMMELLRPIPSVAILPLAVLVLGIGFRLGLVLVAIGAFWPLLIQTIYGVQDVDPEARDMARAYGLGTFRIFGRVVLPGATPYVFTGIRISAIVALNVVVAVEFVVGTTGGMGAQMNVLEGADRIPELYSYVVMAGILGLIINLALRRAERRVLHWHHSQRRVVPL